MWIRNFFFLLMIVLCVLRYCFEEIVLKVFVGYICLINNVLVNCFSKFIFIIDSKIDKYIK